MPVSRSRRARGITLVELLVAVAIIAILSAVVFPNYNRYQLRSYRTQAFTDLASCALQAERVRTNTFSYVTINDDGEPAAEVCPTRSPSDATADVDARYLITVTAADATTFTLRATPVNGQVGDGLLELDASGARRWDKDNDNNLGDAGENNWDE
jgi:type IV pilus assembly protein PilE